MTSLQSVPHSLQQDSLEETQLTREVLAGARCVFVLSSLELGGAERQAIHLASFLKRSFEIDVEVWGFAVPGPAEELCARYGLRSRRVANPLQGSVRTKISGVSRFVKELRAVRPDVLLPYTMGPNIACGLIWRLTGARLCIWNQRDEGRGRVRRVYERLAVNHMPMFISNSSHAATFLTQTVGVKPGRVFVVRNGIAVEPPLVSRQEWRERHEIPQGDFVACMLANLHRYKDHATLLRAWRLVVSNLSQHGVGATLLLAGRQDDTTSQLKELARSLDLGSHVRFLGVVADVSSLLGAIDLCAFSSQYEGCPNGILECMGAGLAVAATDIPGIREALGSQGEAWLSPPGDHEVLASNIITLALDGALRTRSGSANRQRIEQEFGVKRMCAETAALIAKALQSHQATDRLSQSARSLKRDLETIFSLRPGDLLPQKVARRLPPKRVASSLGVDSGALGANEPDLSVSIQRSCNGSGALVQRKEHGLTTEPTAEPEGQLSALHVAHVVLSLDVGGLERGLINQIREGLKSGRRVTMICLEHFGTLVSHLTALGVPVICLSKQPGVRPRLIGPLRRVFQEIRPDIVHTHQIAGLLYSGPAARLAGVPVVVHTEHGKEEYAQSIRQRWRGRLAGRYAARIFCLSEDLASNIRQNRIAPADKVTVIPNGIDTSRFHYRGQRQELRRTIGIPSDAPVIGTVARLAEIKRQDVLLRGFALLRRKIPEAHLVIVGDGPLMKSLRRFAADLDLGATVHFTGHQAEPEPFYEMMDIFTLTSRSEGMPQTIMEAFAAGVPVVASSVGGIPEMIENGRNGLLFGEGDEAGLAQALARLIKDSALARRISAAAKITVEERFHVRRMGEEYHRHFLKLLADCGR